MERLKGLPRTILLLIAGGVLITVGAAQEFSIGLFSVVLPQGWIRFAIIAIGALVIVVAVTLLTSQKMTERVQRTATAPLIGYLFTLDDRQDTGFVSATRDADKVWIFGRSGVNVVSLYTQPILDLLLAGCEVRFLLVDPACEAARFLYGKNFEIYHRNMAQAASHLQRLNDEVQRRGQGRPVTLRLMSDIPPFSLMLVQKKNPMESFINVQLNLIHTRIGRDRPMFRIHRADPWYDSFMAEFDAVWRENSEACTPAELQMRVDRARPSEYTRGELSSE